MTPRSIAKTLTALSLASAVATGARWRVARPESASAAIVPGVIRPTVRANLGDPDSLDEAASLTVDNDPFRLSNSAPTVRFSLNEAASSGTTTSGIPQQRPVLMLKAIVGGPPWQAVIDGIPGQPPGTIAESGKRFDKFLVRSVTRDSVIVQGPDTSWVLSFRRGP